MAQLKRKSKVTLNTVYRRVLKLEKTLSTQMAVHGLRVEGMNRRIQSLAPIVKHCERLLREKEVLRERLQLVEANRYMARGPRLMFREPCTFKHLHRAGIKCAVCEVTP